jgi:hypothetical protein
MKPASKRRRLAGIAAVAALTAACTGSPPAAPALACTTVPVASGSAAGANGRQSGLDLSSVRGILVDVATWSSKCAVAVGWPVPPHKRALVALWNGAAWKTVSSRALPWASELQAVALFPGGAWAVGKYGNAEHKQLGKPLIVRVTDMAARRVPVPGPEYGWLADVAATSATDAWAVGSASGNASGPPLIVHWNGASWTRERLPATVRGGYFYSVAATSRTNAWAVGYSFGGPLMVHWNGTAWTRVPLPATLGRLALLGVAATSRTNAWAVTSLKIVHWNGRRWGQVVTPRIGITYAFWGVAATSARNAWATGSHGSGRAVILHWDGRRWTCALTTKMRCGFPSLSSGISVSASSADNAWAVGNDGTGRILALHWNGHTWKRS